MKKKDKPKRKRAGRKSAAAKKAKLDVDPAVSGDEQLLGDEGDIEFHEAFSESASDAAGSGSDVGGCPETRPGSAAVAELVGSDAASALQEGDSLADLSAPSAEGLAASSAGMPGPPSSSSSSPSSSKSSDEGGSDSDSSSASTSSTNSSQPKPAGSAAPTAAGKAKPKATPKVKGVKLRDRSFYWGDHLITPVGPPGEDPKSFQIRCAKASHNVERACAKKRSVTFGGADSVLLCLKYWASLGCQCESAPDHLALWDSEVMPAWRAGTIPEEADLNSAAS